jgi:hypothetical protein
MFKASIKPYRYNALELFLLKRVEKIYLDSGYSFFRWPEVYFGNFKDFPFINPDQKESFDRDYNLYDIDYLGHYVYTHNKEGHIRIYKDRIENCANRIAKNLGLNGINVINNLLTIVLVHEIGHWITHSCHIKNRRIRLQGFASQEKIIIESLAQLTVVWSTLKLKNEEIKDLNNVFDYLVDRQPYPYQEFRRLGNKQSHIKTLLKRYGYIADDHEYKFGYDFNYFLHGDKIYKKKINSIS